MIDIHKSLKDIEKKISNKIEQKDKEKKDLPKKIKKAAEIWKINFRKDKNFAIKLKSIAESIDKNTLFQYHVNYSTFYDKNTHGFIEFGIKGGQIKLELLNDEVLCVSSESLSGYKEKDKLFKTTEISECKNYFIEKILETYENLT
jgi:hypothetical protein